MSCGIFYPITSTSNYAPLVFFSLTVTALAANQILFGFGNGQSDFRFQGSHAPGTVPTSASVSNLFLLCMDAFLQITKMLPFFFLFQYSVSMTSS